MADKFRSSSDTRCNRRMSSDSWEDLSRELRQSLDRFNTPPPPPATEPAAPPPRGVHPAPTCTPPRNLSEVTITTTYCHDICVGPDEAQLPNPPTEPPGGGEYETDRPSRPFDGWDRPLPHRIEVRYIPMSLQWFQGRFHDKTEMVGSFKKDCRAWLWKNRPAQLQSFTGDVVETPVITELPPAEALPPISEGERELPPQYYGDLDIPSE